MMNEGVYQMYVQTKKVISIFEEKINKVSEDADLIKFIEDLKFGLSILDKGNPEYKERYERDSRLHSPTVEE